MLLKILITLLRFSSRLSRKRTILPQEVKTILIVELTRLGDVISMLPSVRMISSHYPYAKVHVLVNKLYANLLGGLDLDIEVHGIPEPQRFRGFLGAVTRARDLGVDLACSMSPPKRNSAVVLASGAKAKVGYLTYMDSLTPYLEINRVEGFGCDLTEEQVYAMENIEERSAKICRALGINVDARTRQAMGRVRVKPRGSELSLPFVTQAGAKYIVIHPFAGWKYRTWGLERYCTVAERIISQTKYEVVFLYADDEADEIRLAMDRFIENGRVHFFGSRDLFESACVISGASLVICNDSGPLHLASALGVKTVGLFGPAAPSLTAPQDRGGTYLFHKVDCSPCEQFACIRPNDPCIELISAEEVYGSVVRSLSAEPASRSAANA